MVIESIICELLTVPENKVLKASTKEQHQQKNQTKEVRSRSKIKNLYGFEIFRVCSLEVNSDAMNSWLVLPITNTITTITLHYYLLHSWFKQVGYKVFKTLDQKKHYCNIVTNSWSDFVRRNLGDLKNNLIKQIQKQRKLLNQSVTFYRATLYLLYSLFLLSTLGLRRFIIEWYTSVSSKQILVSHLHV